METAKINTTVIRDRHDFSWDHPGVLDGRIYYFFFRMKINVSVVSDKNNNSLPV